MDNLGKKSQEIKTTQKKRNQEPNREEKEDVSILEEKLNWGTKGVAHTVSQTDITDKEFL